MGDEIEVKNNYSAGIGIKRIKNIKEMKVEKLKREGWSDCGGTKENSKK